MPKLARKEIKLFCEAAPAEEYGVSQFGSLAAGEPVFSKDPDIIQALPAFRNGWTAAVVNEQSPAIEDRNALDYLLSYNQVYISQMGIPEWISTQTYYRGSVVTNGQESIYISLVDNNLNNPLTDDVYWARFPTPSELVALNARVDYITPPPGALAFGPVTTMTGYLLCNGQAVSRTTYANLFTAIGTNFGAGDGSTTFNVPDYRGCFLRGLGGNSAADMYTKQPMGAPNITGSFSVVGEFYESGLSGAFSAGGRIANAAFDGNNARGVINFSASDSNSTYGSADEIRPVNFAVNYFIKY